MKCLHLVLLLALSFIAVNAQEPAQQPSPQQDVIRTNTDLVQTAITVLDKKGKFVDGLQREQFELTVDGKSRPITFLERIAAGSPRERELTARGLGVNPGAPLPPATVPGRTIVFFIDDLHLEPDSLNRTRMMLQHFLDREMSSKDNVAIASASGQIGFLEQFTNNRAVLDAAIARLLPRQYDAEGYSVGSATKMTEYMALHIDSSKGDDKVLNFYIEECMKGASTFRKAKQMLAIVRASCETQVKNSARAVLMQAAQITQNTYNSLESLMRSAARAPGRKLAFFVSDGFLLDAGPHAAATRDKLEHVIDAAQRGGVVVYTIHAKGLVNSTFVDPGGRRPFDGGGRLDIASTGELEATQDAMSALAADTGGRALRNTNFFERWLTNVLEETSNYYLVAWRPENDEEKTTKFRHIKILITGQPELSVRAPRGYVNGPKSTSTTAVVSDPAKPNTPDTEMRDALVDTFPAPGLPVLLSLTYLNTPANGLVVTSSLKISARGLTFGADGTQPATIRLAGVVLNDKGKIAGSFRNQFNVNPRKVGEADEGIFYNHHTPLTPGIYQFRVAARDEKSGLVGSAMQWIVIPDLARNQLTLSSLLLGGQVLEDRNKTASPQVQLSVDHSFARTAPLGYWIFVYNAKRDSGGNPQLTVQTHVLRDGQPVLSSPLRKVNNGGPDPQRIPFGEELALKTLAPGRYDLKVTITDALAGTTASQIADFIVR
ncbi:MAG TPA: VWA domain-containing protein [Pyrinomonadaceae bacterium]|nr:VWA domain-containing protein [Pyrinomonadaceae bacterium]